MFELYSTEEIRKFDSFCIDELGIPGLILMENAAESIVNSLFSSYGMNYDVKIGIVCGKGNNGGDGFAVARKLFQMGNSVLVFQLFDENEFTEDAKKNFDILNIISAYDKKVKIFKVNSLKDLSKINKCEVIIDAILGSGTKGKLLGFILETVQFLNKINSFKVAIDIPTGLNGDNGAAEVAFIADLTVSLGGLKKGLYTENGRKFSGEVQYGSIGILPSTYDEMLSTDYLTDASFVSSFIPKKEKNINKYKSGKVLTIAGSGEYPGAGILTGKTPFYCGSGASVLVYPEEYKNLAIKKSKELVVYGYKNENKNFNIDVLNKIKSKIDWADVVVIGPGLGRSEETEKALGEYFKNRNNKLTVIDADALYFFRNGNYENYDLTNTILTPHLGEFSQMTDIPVEIIKNDIYDTGKRFSISTNSYLILKGPVTHIFEPRGLSYVNPTGNEGLAKFGSGDVLTGIIGGIISQQKEKIIESILLSVFIHGYAADLLKESKTVYSFTASDLIKKIPESIKYLIENYD